MDELLKLKSFDPSSELLPLMRQMRKGAIPIEQKIQSLTSTARTSNKRYLLNIFFNTASLKILNSFTAFFQKNKENPFFQRLVFDLSSCELAPQKLDFLYHQAEYNPNILFGFEHVFKEDLFNFLHCLGTTPIISHHDERYLMVLLKNGANPFVSSQTQKYWPLLDPFLVDKSLFKTNLEQQGYCEKNIDAIFYRLLKIYQEKVNTNSQTLKLKTFSNHENYDGNCIQWAIKCRQDRKLEQLHIICYENPHLNLEILAPSFIKQFLNLKEKSNSLISTYEYLNLHSAMRTNNVIVLEHLNELKDLVSYKNTTENFIFEIIKVNKIKWLEKVWSMDCLPHFALNENRDNYLYLAFKQKKGLVFDFLQNNLDFSQMPEDQLVKIEKLLVNELANQKSNHRTEFMKNLRSIVEMAKLKKESSANNTSQPQKIKLL